MKLHSFIDAHSSLLTMLILIFAFGLRLVLIDRSFWLDEAAQAFESSRPLSQQLNIPSDFQPPLYHLLVHVFIQFSKTEWWLRQASLIPSLITIYMTILLGTKLKDKPTGLLAGLLLSLSQLHIFYSQELRPYAFATMWATISMYRYLVMVRSKEIDWGYVIATTAGIYSVYTYPFLVLAQIVATLWLYPALLKRHLTSLLVVLLLCLPWLPSFIGQLQAGFQLTQTLPGWDLIVSPPWFKSLLLIPPKFIFGRLDLPDSPFLLLGIVGFLGIYLYLMLRSPRDRTTRWLWLWLALPLLLSWLVSFVVPVLEPKRLLFCLPALFLLVSMGILSLKRPVLGLVFVISVSLTSLLLYWLNADFQREPWRQAVSQVESLASNNSVVIFPWSSPYASYSWYATKDLRHFSFESLPITIQSLHPKLKALDEVRPDKVFVFEYLMSLTDPTHLIFSELSSRGYRHQGELQFPGIGRIFIYAPEPVFALSRPLR